MGTTTTNVGLYKPTEHEDGWAALVNANFDTLDQTFRAPYRLTVATAVADSTITLNQPPPADLASGYRWVVIDPWSTNCEIRKAASVAGNVVTLTTAKSISNSLLSFAASTKRISLSSGTSLAAFFPGMKITVSGSVSNNGVYTVADIPRDGTYTGTYLTVVEALVDESAGATVTVAIKINRVHGVGSEVIFLDRPILPLSLYGVLANGDTAAAASNVLGWNRGIADAYYTGLLKIQMPAGTTNATPQFIITDDELYLERGMSLYGTGPDQGGIKPHTTFTTGAERGILHCRVDGRPCTVVNTGVSARWNLYDIRISGGSLTASSPLAGIIGIISSPQQPCEWWNIKVLDLDGDAIALTDVQQHSIHGLSFSDCKTGLNLRTVRFFWVHDFNSETIGTRTYSPVAAVKTGVAANTSTGCFSHLYEGIHIEDGGDVYTEAVFSFGSMQNVEIATVYWANSTGNTFAKFATGSAGGPSYALRNLRSASSNNSTTWVDDIDAGQSYAIASDAMKYQQMIVSGGNPSPSAAATEAGPAIAVFGFLGSYVKIGPTNATSTYQTANVTSRRQNSNSRHMSLLNTSGTEEMAINSTNIEFIEASDPAAPVTNHARLYAKDNGAGKTQIVVRFPTGAVQVIATEP